VDTAADHDMFKLPGLDEVANLSLGDADARRKLLWGFETVSHGDLLCRCVAATISCFSASLGACSVFVILVNPVMRYLTRCR
jgi:hypothetical protein